MLQGEDVENDGRNELLDEARRQPELGNWHAVIPYAGVLAAATFLVLLIVSVTLYMEDQRRAANMPPSPEATEDWQARIITVPNSDSYKAALSAYTSSEHRAGTDAGHDLAVWTQAQLEKEGFSVHVYQYTVLLSYPTFLSAKLLFPIQHTCATVETPIAEDPTSKNAAKMPAYNGYSGSGTAVGELIYVNYGRIEDFELLDRMGINVEGRIVIVRYGQNFRGIKAMLAQERGAAGVLIYSDPADDGYVRGPVYPDGPWRPPQAIQRGSVQFSQTTYPGDPTTPGRPSIEGVERLPLDKANIPKIPVQPISYADAFVLLQQLTGPLPDRSWQGGLNFTYKLGPGPAQFNLTVVHKYSYDPIWNVIGKIEGKSDPSKCIIVGNHRDAWNFGGRDPASGSATLLEVARSLGALLKEGWRPYRTIMLASWDAEEQGLVGSTEWAEQFGAQLQTSVIAYLNVDGGVSGTNFATYVVPSLVTAVHYALAMVPDPTPGQERTLFDEAIEHEQSIDPAATEPIYFDLGSGSDFTPFFQHLGLPSGDFAFHGPHGVYHSIYDSYTHMEKFGDPGFLRGPALARFFGVLILSLSDSQILPFRYTDYGERLHDGITEIRRLMSHINDTVLATAIARFMESAHDLEAHMSSIDASDVLKAKLDAFNDRLFLAEQQFLYPDGLSGRPFFRHAIFAPGVHTGYEARIFPDLREAVDDGDQVQAAIEAAKVAAVINAAADYLDATRLR